MDPLEAEACPFCNLPDQDQDDGAQGLTADKMKDCRWLRPELTGRVEFLEWTQVLEAQQVY
ncbi:MAG TPA: hypothetical protein VMQ86_11870 [Bryobacteraceae bacterium]|jgi:bifunctional non-homologous end joining protein LigD|nr:hypothetical protein [Bryobacteraceae bacterium]